MHGVVRATELGEAFEEGNPVELLWRGGGPGFLSHL